MVDFHGMTSQSLANGMNYRVSIDLREADNYRDHNESSYVNGFGKIGYEHTSGSLFAEMQYIDDELKTPGTLFDDEVTWFENDGSQVFTPHVLPAPSGPWTVFAIDFDLDGDMDLMIHVRKCATRYGSGAHSAQPSDIIKCVVFISQIQPGDGVPIL